MIIIPSLSTSIGFIAITLYYPIKDHYSIISYYTLNGWAKLLSAIIFLLDIIKKPLSHSPTIMEIIIPLYHYRNISSKKPEHISPMTVHSYYLKISSNKPFF
jgi:hypothetical protein